MWICLPLYESIKTFLRGYIWSLPKSNCKAKAPNRTHHSFFFLPQVLFLFPSFIICSCGSSPPSTPTNYLHVLSPLVVVVGGLFGVCFFFSFCFFFLPPPVNVYLVTLPLAISGCRKSHSLFSWYLFETRLELNLSGWHLVEMAHFHMYLWPESSITI